MPFIKAISGHTRLGAAQRYLEKEGRALARDFLNLDAPMEGRGERGRSRATAPGIPRTDVPEESRTSYYMDLYME